LCPPDHTRRITSGTQEERHHAPEHLLRSRSKCMATEKARGCPKRTAPHFLERWRRALACKPNSVCPERRPPCRFRGDHHLSGTAVTGSLKRPTRAAAPLRKAAPFSGPPYPPRGRCGAAWPCTPRGLPAAAVTSDAGGLLPHPFTLCLCPAQAGPSAGLLSVALSVTARLPERCPPVRRRGALWCSDFPRRRASHETGDAMVRPAHHFR